VIRSNRRKTSEILVSKSGVEVLSPMGKKDDQIKKLVKLHSKWIYQKQLQARQENTGKNTYKNNSKLFYLGKKYTLKIVKSKQNSFSFKNGEFVARLVKPTGKNTRELYVEWSKQKALPIIEKSAIQYSKKLGVKPLKISIKNQKNRWGSVAKNRTIHFNHTLIRAPKKILDYVIAHELCHLKIPDHSEPYWRLLDSIMPDYENRKEWLRINKDLLTN